MQPGLGIIPMLLGLNNSSGIHNVSPCVKRNFVQQQPKKQSISTVLSFVSSGVGNRGYAEPLTPEQQHQVISTADKVINVQLHSNVLGCCRLTALHHLLLWAVVHLVQHSY